MAVRIGNQTAFSALPITGPFEFAVDNGFDAFEWFPDKKGSGEGWAETDISGDTRVWIRKSAQENNITLTVHAPWQVNPALPGGSDQLLKTLDFAEEIGASLINIHLYKDQGFKRYLHALVPIMQHLVAAGIQLSIENTRLTNPEDFNELFAQLKEWSPAGMANIGMCLDLGHANLCETTHNDYLRFMDLLGAHVPIIHVHAHENHGDSDSHLTLFTGPSAGNPVGIVGFVERLAERHFSGTIILEQWPQPPRLLIEARNRLTELINRSFQIDDVSSPLTSQPKVEDGRNSDLRSGINIQLAKPEGTCFNDGHDTDDFVRMIAARDHNARSWRQKLMFIQDIVTDRAHVLGAEQLVYLAIYLRFISSGQIPLFEDGSHYRPSHHARMAQNIHARLAEIATPANSFIIRKIISCLPSTQNFFTRAEPLTRIRDIAHRNDIPKELKQAIKETLQNKLHRCAGPEDLETSAAILEKITLPGADYSPAFVEEFKRFHLELQEFFNALSLDEQLRTIRTKTGQQGGDLIGRFLVLKGNAHSLPRFVSTLEILVRLRSVLKEKMGHGAIDERRELEIADIKLEEHSFGLISQIVNRFMAREKLFWDQVLRSTAIAVQNLRLSQFDGEECQAIESELDNWRGHFDPGDHEELIRLKATLDRCKRLTDYYCSKILRWFPEGAERLGRLLGVPELAIRTFAESDIRSHPVFQVSRLTAFITDTIRTLGGLSTQSVIVSGVVSGRLLVMDRMHEIPPGSMESAVVCLSKAEGDEEIPHHVVGIIIPHQTPHLSHLAVRARQAKVAFVISENNDSLMRLRQLHGQKVRLEAGPETFKVESLDGSRMERVSNDEGKPLNSVSLPIGVTTSRNRPFLPLGQASLATAGAKATSLRMLNKVSKRKGADFKVPHGFVVPFGVMESSLSHMPALEDEYIRLSQRLDELTGSKLINRLDAIKELINRLSVPGEILQESRKAFPAEARLMVRSSSNLEDLSDFSAAGLYDSVVAVSQDGLADAVRTVWSSLWTKRAVLSRADAGISHEMPHMAVLIQQMVLPELSFIMHTVNPLSGNPYEIYVELAPGLGQPLASCDEPGTPFRFIGNKRSGTHKMLAFANFSHCILPKSSERGAVSTPGTLRQTVDYSNVRFSCEKTFRNQIGSRLARIGIAIEEAFGMPQDIEGLISADGTIHVVQSRPQHV